MATAADSARSSRSKGPSHTFQAVFSGRTVFLSSAILGSTLVFLGEPFNSPFLLGVVGPIATMLVYMALGLAGYIESADDESFADSIYYLGFVLTLISLAAALVYLRNDHLHGLVHGLANPVHMPLKL